MHAWREFNVNKADISVIDGVLRSPSVYWKQQVENLVGIYGNIYDLPGVNSDTALAHAVQKDAIQNSLDARIHLKKWSVIFELADQFRYVTITDMGTCGLTGRAQVDEEELSNLDFEKYSQERWSRFEGLGYANKDPRAIGARGQGKFIFIGSSKTQQMIYDTLREDGIYRVGAWVKTGARTLIFPREGDEAKKYLQQRAPGLKPLENIGTRIVILNPKDELARSFLPLAECDLMKYVAETWWETIKNGGRMFIRYKGVQIQVPLPGPYLRLEKEPERFEIFRCEDLRIRYKWIKAKVKELVIAYSKDQIPEQYRGIAIQRGSMKVTAFDILYGNEHIPPEYRKHVFGWLILDDRGERLLKESESPNHYDFRKRRGTFAQLLLGRKGWLSKQVRKFAKEVLGVSLSKKRERAKSEIEVLNTLNKIARAFGYSKPAWGGKGRKTTGKRGPTRKIRIQMPEPKYPGPTRMVRFGEVVKKIEARVANETDREILLRFTCELIRKEDGVAVVKFKGTTLKLLPSSISDSFGPYSVAFSKGKFSAGTYMLESKIVSLTHEKIVVPLDKGGVMEYSKGDKIHRLSHLVYLERKPPAVGLFKDILYEDFKEGDKRQFDYDIDDNDRITLRVNRLHPLYQHSERMQQILETKGIGDFQPLDKDYILDLGIAILVEKDLVGDARLLEDNRDKYLKKREKDEILLYEDVLNLKKNIEQRLLFDVYATK